MELFIYNSPDVTLEDITIESVLTGLILEVRVLPVGEEPGLQTERESCYILITHGCPPPSVDPADAARAIIALRHVRT